MSENNQTMQKLKKFREQIKEDIEHLKEKLSWDKNIQKDEYAFNYWVLGNLYSLEEEVSNNNITEYNDKGIDCWVHHEYDKKLYLIQNKYYCEKTNFDTKELSDFLNRPLASLQAKDNYKNKELQKIFDKAKGDTEYSIELHFYLTQEKGKDDCNNLIKTFTSTNRKEIKANLKCHLFLLEDIYDKYYGKSFKENPHFETRFTTKNKGTYLRIEPQEYDLLGMTQAFYVLTPVTDIFYLYDKAQKEQYPLFEKNIREYLGGGTGINKENYQNAQKQ